MDAASDRARLSTELAVVARSTWPALIVIALAGAAYVTLMPPGLPYDEPAHWLNVLWWLDHWSMPAIGDAGTSYEAQMGPVAYVVYAVVAWPFRAAWGDEAAFYAARGLGIVQLAALALVLAVAARRALRPRRGIAILVVLAVGLNPMLLAVSTSIQNDTLSLLLGALALLVAVAPSRRSRRNAVVAGILLGLALLTKLTVWPIAVGIAVVLLMRRRPLHLAVVALSSLVVSGWWFARNLALYGDLTGRSAVAEAGYEFPALDAGPAALARHVVTYLWLPTEYVRNVIVSPTVIDGLVLLLSAFAAVGLVLFAVHRGGRLGTALAIAVTAVIAVVAWVIVVESTQAIAFRTAYPALLALYAGIGALAFLGARRALVAMVVPLVIVDAWFLVSLATLTGVQAFITF